MAGSLRESAELLADPASKHSAYLLGGYYADPNGRASVANRRICELWRLTLTPAPTGAPGGAAIASASWLQLPVDSSALGPGGSAALPNFTSIADYAATALYEGRIFQFFGRYDTDIW